MGHEEILAYTKQAIKDHPSIKDEIFDLWLLYCNESANGSEAHEAELCYESIQQLIEEQ